MGIRGHLAAPEQGSELMDQAEISKFFTRGAFLFLTCRICGAAVPVNEGSTAAAELHVRHHEAMALLLRGLIVDNIIPSSSDALQAHELGAN